MGDFYYRRQLLSQGVVICPYMPTVSVNTGRKKLCGTNSCGVGIMIRGKVSEYADYILAGSEESGLLKGILIGDKNDFSENLYSDMSKSGFMHIAAVSGLHVSFFVRSFRSAPFGFQQENKNSGYSSGAYIICFGGRIYSICKPCCYYDVHIFCFRTCL